jgi:hypothetical protein
MESQQFGPWVQESGFNFTKLERFFWFVILVFVFVAIYAPFFFLFVFVHAKIIVSSPYSGENNPEVSVAQHNSLFVL